MGPEHRIAPRIDLVHRDRDDAVAVGVFEGEIDPDLRRRGKPRHVELARRDHDLPLGAVDLIAIDIDAAKDVIGPQALDLLQLRLERAPIPDARVLQRGGVLGQIGGRQRR